MALGIGRNGAMTIAGQVNQRPQRFTRATNFWLRLRCQIRGKPFNGASHLIKLDDILFGEIDHASTSATFLGDEPVTLKKIDGLADCSLRHAEMLRPFDLDDSSAWRQSSVHDLCQQLICQRLFDEAIGRK